MKQWTCQCGSLSPLIGRESDGRISNTAARPFYDPRAGLHCGPCTASRIPLRASFRLQPILRYSHHFIACDGKIDAERLRNSEHESIANPPVADLFAEIGRAHV